jgi:HEAT repeat protein
MDLLELGIAAARAKNRTEARMYLEAATLEDPANEQAFLWLSFVLDDPKLAMRCLERVLELDPDNQQARRGLEWLRSKKGTGELLPQRLSDAEMEMALQSLRHPDERVVVKAIRRLGEGGDARAVDPLVKLLASTKSKTVQSQARTALIAIGTPSVDPVQRLLLDETNPEVALQLAAVLARVHSIAALTACREVTERARHPAARYAVVLNLTASVHGEAALGIVRNYVDDAGQDQRARAAILMAIGQAIKGKTLDANQGVRFLMDIQADPHLRATLGHAALMALGVSSQPSVLRYILEAMGDRDTQRRVVAVDAVARFTLPQTALLEKLARSPDPVVRKRANQILDQLKSHNS